MNVFSDLILHDSPNPDGFAGYSTEFAINYRDWVSLVSRLDIVKFYPGDYDQVFQIGIKFGSYVGLGLTRVSAVV